MTTTTETKLPPDPDGQNDDRAEWAAEAFSLFAEITGCEPGQEAASDLLCNYFHWCDRNGVDMETMIDSARSMYREETQAE